jgi:hypothetical protein
LNVRDSQELSLLKEHFFKKADASGRDAQAVRVSLAILFDLSLQGWKLEVTRSGVRGKPPEPDDKSPEGEKRRLRNSHLHERDNQLRQRSTREFVRKMERKRQGPQGWVSIFSVMRDGGELTEKLLEATTIPEGPAQIAHLKTCVAPYLQIVESDAYCPLTGLRLADIWRYFRHTWTTPYNSTPGRKIWILVRDAAAENHPVIGIAAISSAVVQLSARDAWIGWRSEEFLKRLRLEPDAKWGRWLRKSLSLLIDGIYKKDFLAESILTSAELRFPKEATIANLLRESRRARNRHQKYPKREEHKGRGRVSHFIWRKQARLDLFRAKRAESLAGLLDARMKLRHAGFRTGRRAELQGALESTHGRRAIEVVLKHVKASHIGIDMLDITVCGAVAPYNSILGGKLVSLLLTSPEIVKAYAKRYSNSPSIIASSMAGRPIRRVPRLVFLGTTGMYRVNPSQYNRLRIEAADVGGKKGEWIRFERLGESEGFGSYHLSQETGQEIAAFLAQSHPGTRVNSIFGEGVNPKLRKLREGVDLLGLDSNTLLNHRSSRVVYGIPIASNFRDVLLGLTDKPRYILPQARPREITRQIGDFWVRRWMARRILNQDVLAAVSAHSLSYPICHGARVVLPTIPHESQPPAVDQDDTTRQSVDIRLPLSAPKVITVTCSAQC